jgi:hypothetical protein
MRCMNVPSRDSIHRPMNVNTVCTVTIWRVERPTERDKSLRQFSARVSLAADSQSTLAREMLQHPPIRGYD